MEVEAISIDRSELNSGAFLKVKEGMSCLLWPLRGGCGRTEFTDLVIDLLGRISRSEKFLLKLLFSVLSLVLGSMVFD